MGLDAPSRHMLALTRLCVVCYAMIKCDLEPRGGGRVVWLSQMRAALGAARYAIIWMASICNRSASHAPPDSVRAWVLDVTFLVFNPSEPPSSTWHNETRGRGESAIDASEIVRATCVRAVETQELERTRCHCQSWRGSDGRGLLRSHASETGTRYGLCHGKPPCSCALTHALKCQEVSNAKQNIICIQCQ